MMHKEFEELAGYEVSYEDYINIIEPMYMATNLSKQEFVKCVNRKQFDKNYKKQQYKKQLLSEMKNTAKEMYDLCSHTDTYEQYETLRSKALEYIKAFPVWKAPHHEFTTEHKNGCTYVKALVWYCKNKGIRIGDIEETIGVSKGYISRLQGKKTISVGKAYLIAKIFDVSLDDMLSKSLWREEKERELLEQIRALEEEVKKLRTMQ